VITDPTQNPFYSLDYLDYLVESVLDRYSALFSAEELSQLTQYRALPQPSRALYARLTQRKGPYFRLDRLRYKEIIDTEQAAVQLVATRFAAWVGSIRPDLQLALRTKAELKSLGVLAAYDLEQAAKPAIDQALLAQHCQLPTLSILQLKCGGLIALCEYLFFGNRHQTLSEFVVTDLGLHRYENVDLVKSSAFASRSMLNANRLVDQLRAWAHLLEQESKTLKQNPDETRKARLISGLQGLKSMVPSAEDLLNYALTRGLDKLHLSLGQSFERVGHLTEALMCYEQTERAPASERRARIAFKQSRPEEAVGVCRAILKDCPDPKQRAYATKQLLKLDLIARERDSQRYDTQTLNLALTQDLSVEQQVIGHLESTGKIALHTENHLYNGLFGMLFWDIIFAPVPGAFYHPFQREPADLMEPDFTLRRQSLFEARFDELESLVVRLSLLTLNWREKQGIANPFVAWKSLDLATFEFVLRLTPWSALKAIFKRLLSHFQSLRSGFPDLLVMDTETYELIEIKGPGDKLQTHQIAWLNFLADQGIRTSVMTVAQESSSTSKERVI
jgi:hypothetical protein